MESNYWTRRGRLSRRTLLQGTALVGLGTAGLALTGCGDDDDEDGATPTGTTAPGTTTAGSPTAAPTEQIKKGGIYQRGRRTFLRLRRYRSSDTTLRARFAGASSLASPCFWGAGRPDFPSQEQVPDLIEGYEVPGDGLTYTMKVHPKAMWHPPLSRSVTADDVVFSFERFFGRAGGATPAPNLDQLSMIDSVKAIDSGTVQFKLKAPSALFLIHIADDYVIPIMPTETGTAFDPAQTAVGSGAFMIDSLQAGVSFNLKRFPEWHLGPDKPYLDGIANTVIKEPATGLAQFKGGNLDTFGPVSPKDLKGVKDAVKDVQINGLPVTYMGFVALSGKDKRHHGTRTCVSGTPCRWRSTAMRSLTFYSPNDLEAAGVERPKTRWHGTLPAGLGPQWLDPQGSKMEPSSRKSLSTMWIRPSSSSRMLATRWLYAEYHYTTSTAPTGSFMPNS